MKSFAIFAAAAAVCISASPASSQQFGCANGCFNDWSGSDCSKGSDWSCICGNTTAIDQVNSCISSSTDCSDSDKDASYQAIAQACANSGTTITASPEATWSATSGGSAWPTSLGSNTDWSSWADGVWGTGSGSSRGPSWTTKSGTGPWQTGAANWTGAGPFGGDHPWGSWASSGSWTTGPWTAWWGGSACPPSTWSGWTSGSWSTNAPWTTWSGCAASTTATSTYTTTVSGSASTGVSYGVKVAQATSTGASGSAGASASVTSSDQGSAASTTTFALGSLAAALMATLMVL